jgi:hypothetical protein
MTAILFCRKHFFLVDRQRKLWCKSFLLVPCIFTCSSLVLNGKNAQLRCSFQPLAACREPDNSLRTVGDSAVARIGGAFEPHFPAVESRLRRHRDPFHGAGAQGVRDSIAARPVERREQWDRRGCRLCCFRVADRMKVMHMYAWYIGMQHILILTLTPGRHLLSRRNV